jgi:hypothetical protein
MDRLVEGQASSTRDDISGSTLELDVNFPLRELKHCLSRAGARAAQVE